MHATLPKRRSREGAIDREGGGSPGQTASPKIDAQGEEEGSLAELLPVLQQHALELVAEQKDAMGARLRQLARALHAASAEFAGEREVSEPIEGAAGRLDEIADFLVGHPPGEVVQQIRQSLAGHGLLVGGALVAGWLAARAFSQGIAVAEARPNDENSSPHSPSLAPTCGGAMAEPAPFPETHAAD